MDDSFRFGLRAPRRISLSLGGCLGVLAAAPLAADFAPAGPEFQVNTYTTSKQRFPSVASDGAGNFVVVFESDGSAGGDTSGYSIQGRRFDAQGQPLDAQWQVNTETGNYQFSPAVACDPAGNFLVVWQSDTSSGPDITRSIQGRFFDAFGQPAGPDFQVNDFTSGPQQYPAVAADAVGNFVVVWESLGSDGSDTSGKSVRGRWFLGAQPLSEFQVNTFTTGHQSEPAVAAAGSGEALVAWTSAALAGPDTDTSSVQAQRSSNFGTPLGPEFQVNTYATGAQRRPAVAMHSSGTMIVVWESNGSGGSDSSLTSVQGQRYDANLGTLGPEFQVNTYTTDQQRTSAVGSDPDGGFVVAWTSDGSGGSDGSGTSVQMARYRADGTPREGEFQVNSYTSLEQAYPAIATLPSGDFVVAWESWGSAGSDADQASVQARLFDGLFRDGFESGDTIRWSSATP